MFLWCRIISVGTIYRIYGSNHHIFGSFPHCFPSFSTGFPYVSHIFPCTSHIFPMNFSHQYCRFCECTVPGYRFCGGPDRFTGFRAHLWQKNSCNTKVVFNHFDRDSYVSPFPSSPGGKHPRLPGPCSQVGQAGPGPDGTPAICSWYWKWISWISLIYYLYSKYWK